jgi:hypothetical protein
MRTVSQLMLMVGSALLVSAPALAQVTNRFDAAPAPLIGIGLPVAGLALGAVLLIRHYRKR